MTVRKAWGQRRFPVWTFPTALLFVIWIIGPARFNGYSGDDYHYLAAARCVADHFWCVPTDHWARRAPLVVPVAVSIRLLGLSQTSLWIIPAIYAIAALALFASLVRRLFGFWPAIIGSAALILTPAFAELTPTLGIDVAEFLFLVLAALALERSWATKKIGWSVVFGIAAALAVMCRPTALAALPIFGIAHLGLRLGPRAIAAAAASFLLVLAGEACVYLFLSGDPLLTWKLSLRHTAIESAHLTGVDIRQSPILNIDFIRAWKPAAGIDAPWPMKGLVNLAAHPDVFLTVYWAVALGFLAAIRRRIADEQAHLILWLLAGSAVYFVTLVFVLAIDPQPRMFIALMAILCAILGVCIAALSNGAFLVLGVIAVGTIAFRGLTAPFDRLDFGPINAHAMATERASGMRIPIHPVTARGMALEPGVDQLPIDHGTARRLLVVGLGGCDAMRAWAGLTGWTVAQEFEMPHAVPRAIAWLRREHLFVTQVQDPTLCVFSAPRHRVSVP